MPSFPVSAPFERVILVVLDALRPDAIPRFGLHNIAALAHRGASTMLARTVTPSVTATAMASLLTGSSPERHGLQTSRFFLPRARGPVHPLPRVLAERGMSSSVFISTLPFGFGAIAKRIALHLGLGQTRFEGDNCDEVLDAARSTLTMQQDGLILIHLHDADRAGHATGWMSDSYAEAAQRMDGAMGALVRHVDLANDPGTLLIAVADHGGGGTQDTEHDSDHPLNSTIPIILAGAAVPRSDLGQGRSLLDVPATVCWALGLPQPESYPGKPLNAWYRADRAAAVTVAA